MTGKFYVVATPIGNLEDVTLRAIKILSDVDIILAEDTRVTKKLLDFLSSNHQLQTANLISYHQHSPPNKKQEIVNWLLEGQNIALVTDAGTPGISDPGNELLDYIYEFAPEIKILPIPGASALTTALSVCGFPTNKFVFIGFLPKKKKERLFKSLKDGRITFAFYESPFRLFKSLIMIKEQFGGEVQVFIARELTKMYETLYRASVKKLIDKFKNEKIKGEVVVVVRL